MRFIKNQNEHTEKSTFRSCILAALAALGVFVVLCLIWGIVEYSIYGDPAYDKCMAEYNDQEFCITAPKH